MRRMQCYWNYILKVIFFPEPSQFLVFKTRNWKYKGKWQKPNMLERTARPGSLDKGAYSVPLSTICVSKKMPSRLINSWAKVTSLESLARSFRASSLASILDDWIRSWSCWAFWALWGENKGEKVHGGNHDRQKTHVLVTEKPQDTKTQCIRHAEGRVLPGRTPAGCYHCGNWWPSFDGAHISISQKSNIPRTAKPQKQKRCSSEEGKMGKMFIS